MVALNLPLVLPQKIILLEWCGRSQPPELDECLTECSCRREYSKLWIYGSHHAWDESLS